MKMFLKSGLSSISGITKRTFVLLFLKVKKGVLARNKPFKMTTREKDTNRMLIKVVYFESAFARKKLLASLTLERFLTLRKE